MAEAPAANWNGGQRLDPKQATAVLLVLAAIALMVQYVETMVIPAIPTFQRFFGQPIPTVTWILTAYLLVGTVATPIFSKLGDILGKKRMLVVVMAIYVVAVSVAGFTPNLADALGLSRANAIYLLIGVRGLQGIGIAMFPLAFAMIGEQFPPNRIGMAQGIVASMFAAGAAIGLFGGAWITDNYGWQTTYHSITPFAILALILTLALLPESKVRSNVRLDVPGAAALGAALGAFLVALSEGPSWGWSNFSYVSVGPVGLGVPQFLVVGVVALAAFLLWEPRAKNPIVNFSRLKERNIWISNVVGTTTAASMFIIFVTMVEVVQVPTWANGLGQSVFVSGLLSVPSALAMLVLGPFIGKAVSRFGPRPVMILGGALVMVGGSSLFFFNRTEIQFVLGPMPALVGMVMCFIAMTNVVVLASRPTEMGIQTGMNQTFRNLGMAVGPAIAATILTSFTAIYLIPGTFGTRALVLPTLSGYQDAFLVTAILGAVGMVLSAFLRNYRYLADGTRVEGPSGRPVDVRAPAEGGPAVAAPAK
ncbi:MAG TPA: MFS transporter [Thermoplasmata archaeon]|nr:MFS transporter [Thermoplasmata archaeon]